MSRRRINGIRPLLRAPGRRRGRRARARQLDRPLSWTFVVDDLAQTNHVVTYDRRGHSRSERGAAAVPRRVDEDDLVALIESLDLGPVHLVGNSYGASISLGVATRRPDLVRTVTAHEPPLIGIATPGSALAIELVPVVAALETVAAAVGRGDAEAAPEQFVEDVALGPGAWQLLPLEIRQTMVANAPMIIDVVGRPAMGRAAPAGRDHRTRPAHRRRRQPFLATGDRRGARRPPPTSPATRSPAPATCHT